jgi:DNA-binding SARP family transcriptional activator
MRGIAPSSQQDDELGSRRGRLSASSVGTKVVSREKLIDGLWGENPPREAEHSLEALVFRLPKSLKRNGQDLVLTRPGGYALQVRDGELDLDQFAGPAEEGRTALRDGDAQRAAGEIRAIEDRRLAAAEDLIEVELGCGRHAEVLSDLEQLVEGRAQCADGRSAKVS